VRSSRQIRRVGGLLLAAVLIASQAAAWLHAAAVTHVTCAEHGEALHAATPSAAPDDRPAAPDTVVATVATGDQGDTLEAHDHCASGALLRWRALTVAPPAVTVVVPRFAGAAPFQTGPPALGLRAVYRLAPKTSPPHATI
jgi:hypothetical protein